MPFLRFTPPFYPPSGLRQGFYRQAGPHQRLFEVNLGTSKFLQQLAHQGEAALVHDRSI